MIRYAILYFILLIIFVALIVGPIVAGKQLGDGTLDFANLDLGGSKMYLRQPLLKLGRYGDNDDTRGRLETGTKMVGYSGVWTPTTTSDYAEATSNAERRMAF